MAITEPVTLAEAKTQLRVEFDEDDALISSYITAAREWAEGFLNIPLVPKEGEAAPEVKLVWKQAILLTVSNWYQNREQGGIPDAAIQLLWIYRNAPA